MTADETGVESPISAGLWLIGLGPGDLSMMTEQAVFAAKNCQHRFLEGYTATLPLQSEEGLEDLVGDWSRRMRSAVESPAALLELASKESTALLIVGDPLQATTHVNLQLQAVELGIECRVIHGISITMLVTGAIGLQSYRFGRQTTLVYPYGTHLATSPFDTIRSNRVSGLHTLVLLDLDPTGLGENTPTPMTPEIAIDVLRRSAAKVASECTDSEAIESWKIILCSDMGTDSQEIRCGNLEQLSKITEGRMHCLAIPAMTLHEVEELALERWSI